MRQRTSRHKPTPTQALLGAILSFSFLQLFLPILRFEPGALHMLGKHFPTALGSQPSFSLFVLR